MPSSPMVRRLLIPAALLMTLAACNKSADSGGNSVAMKDLEVVDGTTTDAMTDLDGVRTEGTAMAPASNSTAPRTAPKAASNAADPADSNAEVIADQ